MFQPGRFDGRMMIPRDVLTAAPALVFLATPLVAEALQPGKVWRIGFLFPGSAQINAPRLAVFERGLREL